MSNEPTNNSKEIGQLLDDLLSQIESSQTIPTTTTTTTTYINDIILSFESNDLNSDELLLELDAYFKHIEDFTQDYPLDQQTFMSSLQCDACLAKSSVFWRRVTKRKIVCNSCFFEKAYLILFDDEHLYKKVPNSNESSNNNGNGEKKKNGNKNKSKNTTTTTTTTTNNKPILTRTTAKREDQTLLQSQLSSTSSNCSSPSNNQNSEIVAEDNNNQENTRKSARILKSKQNDDSQTQTSVSGLSLESASAAAAAAIKAEPSDSLLTIESTTGSMNRRTKCFKRKTALPVKVQTSVSKLSKSEYVFHRGFYMQIGDIVALVDESERDSIYFAQIRAFLIDERGQKSAVLTWLVPRNLEHRMIKALKDFDPALFVLGPAEELPRPLECMEFVCRLSECSLRQVEENNASYFDSMAKYKNDLLKHRFALADLAEGDRVKLFARKNSKNGLVEHEIECK